MNHAAPISLVLLLVMATAMHGQRARARELGVKPGVFPPGRYNAITDVAGLRVGHATLVQGDSIRTGVTAILPHEGNVFRERVPAALHVGNAFGKLLGATQLAELGELETPILLTCTLCVWNAADALVGWMLEQPGMEKVRSVNPVVAETNDGTLNAIRSRPIGAKDVRAALAAATSGAVPEGSVGAEGRNRHILSCAASGAGRLDGGCSRPEQLRWHSPSARRSRWARARTIRIQA